MRIARQDGGLVYLSPSPKNQSFDPAALPPPQWPEDVEAAREVPLMGGRRMLMAEHAVKLPGGARYLVEVGAPMDEVRADLRHWLAFRWAMIERLEAAFQQSNRFVADASHELRTPLTIIRGEIEGFVQNARLDADWVKFDLAELAPSTVDQMGLLAEDKRIRVACTGATGIWLQGDRARLKQVVVNLLDRAIKYTPEGGAGLGLSIVKSICAAHHGRVEASSESGRGSRFRVELPRVRPSANPDAGQNEA